MAKSEQKRAHYFGTLRGNSFFAQKKTREETTLYSPTKSHGKHIHMTPVLNMPLIVQKVGQKPCNKPKFEQGRLNQIR